MASRLKLWIFLVVVVVVVFGTSNSADSTPQDEIVGNAYAKGVNEAGVFLKNFETKADDLMSKNGLANWRYETDLTDENLQKTVDIGLRLSEFFLRSSENSTKINTIDLPPLMQRQIVLIRRNADPTSENMRREIKETIGEMTSIFSKGKVKRDGKEYTLNDLTNLMKNQLRSKKKLDWAWKSWRDQVGPRIKSLYANLIDLLNVGAREHGWIDYGDFLRTDYEMGDDFELSLDSVWQKIQPLYEELHAYVRYMLRKKNVINTSKDGCIPADVLGDMFAQNWENVFDLVKPKANSKVFDVTKTLTKKGYTVTKMFKLAETFFQSLGLSKMPQSFWNNSVLTKQKQKEMVCHASAWDISSTDVRIKMCAEVNQNDLTTIHHEMGHIEYYLQYKDQPNLFRAGANPGFHEAIGDTISLSVETPTYMKKVDLMNKDKIDDIGFLLNQALRRLAPLPYNLLVDKWRWRVFEGNITENNYNKAWWDLRVKYQGVEPPVPRPPTAFDPASKFHIGANIPYIAYFFSYILQFQLHKSLCKKAKFSGPLHTCSIFGNKEAGAALKKMLEKGRSQPWPQILKKATGDKELKADAIIEYFAPLKTWLQKQRKSKGYDLKWKKTTSMKVFQKKSKKYEPGQERSGILKTDSGDVSLSINIPAISLAQLVGGGNKEVNATISNPPAPLQPAPLPDQPSQPVAPEVAPPALAPAEVAPPPQSAAPVPAADHPSMEIDLGKLLAAGKSLSIKSSETNAVNSDGNTEIKNKEIDINSDATANKAAGNETAPAAPLQNATAAVEPNAPKNVTVDTSVPLATAQQPETANPMAAVSADEPKPNPAIAGLEKQQSNPATAAVATEPKPNPVPPNQIALVPISLPANLINVLRNAMNSSTITKSYNGTGAEIGGLNPANNTATYAPANATTAEEQQVGKYERLLSNSTDVASLVAPPAEAPSPQNATAQQNTPPVGSQPSNLTLAAEAMHDERDRSPQENVVTDAKFQNATTSLVEAAAEQLTNATAAGNLTQYANETDNPARDSMPDAASFLTQQLVTACKRSGGLQCMQGKVVREGNGMPVKVDGLDASKKTVSISPSLLIKKLIEHHVADKSTPDPVVNAVPVPATATKPATLAAPPAAEPAEKGPIDINQIIKALTGPIKPTGNASSTSADTKQTIQNTDLMNQQQVKSKFDNLNTLMNCSSVQKRGVHLTLPCKDGAAGKHNTLSLSPQELVLRLINSKVKNEANKKSTPADSSTVPNSLQLNFDLNPKDQIPYDSKLTTTESRQQHVDVYNTAKGMVVKPKSSIQLLTPQFVPTNNNDNIELKEG